MIIVEWLKNCDGKTIFIDGLRFTRDNRGYYRNSKTRKRLHQYIWEKYNGKIPEGYHVHHKDHNKANNHIDNLILIKHGKHSRYHINKRKEQAGYEEWLSKNVKENALPKAIEWHKSEEGRKWHSEHGKRIAENRKLEEFICEFCGKKYKTWNLSRNKFCSNKCKSAWRRKEGLDNEERTCVICGNDFVTNKYSKAQTCSRSCSMKLQWKRRKASN